MRRKIPSTAALISFEAAARHESYTRAAQELALTQSAVSRQIAQLESFLNVQLFQRTRHGVLLTPSGAETDEVADGGDIVRVEPDEGLRGVSPLKSLRAHKGKHGRDTGRRTPQRHRQSPAGSPGAYRGVAEVSLTTIPRPAVSKNW